RSRIPNRDEAALRPAAHGGEPSAASRVFDERPLSRAPLTPLPARRRGGVQKKLLTAPTTLYTGVIKGITATTIFPITYGRRTDPSFNFGGVLEFYLSRRVLFRYDFGDTIIHYNTGSLFTTGGQS